jgi:predicted transcriptional regulator
MTAHETLIVQLDPEMKAQLLKVASSERRSMSAVVRIALDEYLTPKPSRARVKRPSS